MTAFDHSTYLPAGLQRSLDLVMTMVRVNVACVTLGFAGHFALGAPGDPPAEFFQRLDTDQDGRISLVEFYPTGPAPLHPRMKQVFESLDREHAGALSFAEAAKAIATVRDHRPNLIPEVEGESRSVPLELHPRTRRAFIKIQVNGVDGVFLFDTGTSDTILHPDFAQRAGVDFVEICMPIIAGNMGPRGDFVSLVLVPDLVIQGMHFRNFHVVLRDPKKPLYEFGAAIDGVLGANVIFVKPVTLDFTRSTFTYEPQKRGPASIELPLRKEEKTATVEADIDGVKVPLLLDSGEAIGDAILINEPHHEAFRKLAGNSEASVYTAKAVRVAQEVIDADVRCLLKPFERSLLGIRFFHQYVITVDTAAGKLLITPNRGTASP